MRVAAGQFAVTPVWRTNAQTCVTMMQQAAREGGGAAGAARGVTGAR